MQVKIDKAGGKLRVFAPFNSLFVNDAKKLNGKWEDPKCWTFMLEDEKRVRELCMTYYGCDGVTEDVVTLRIEFLQEVSEYTGPVDINGRTLARASGRDSGAKLGDQVVLLAGKVRSGGSMKNWKTVIHSETVLLVRRFPRAAAEEAAKSVSSNWKCSIEKEEVTPDTPAVPPQPVVEPPHVPEPAESTDIEALKKERDALRARLREVTDLLASAGELAVSPMFGHRGK